MAKKSLIHERVWERGWEGHERAQRARQAEIPLPDKIAWLEERQRVAQCLQRSRLTRKAKSPRATLGRRQNSLKLPSGR